MNIYDSDNLDRGTYDDLGQQHYHESLDWSDNLFGESIPGEDDAAATGGDDAAATDDGMGAGGDAASVADEDTEGGTDATEEDDTAAQM